MRPELVSFLFQRLAEAFDHPAIHSFHETRLVMDALYGEITRGEDRYFDTLFARMQYGADKYQVPASLQLQLDQAHRHLTGHSSHTVSVEEHVFFACIRAVAEGLSFLSATPVPASLQARLESVRPFEAVAAPDSADIADLRLCILSIGPLQIRNSVVMFQLTGMDPILGEITLELPDGETIRHSYLHPLLKPFQTLRVLQVKKITDTRFTSSSQTLLILEPDILLDISELAECFDFKEDAPLLYIVRKLLPQQPGPALFTGSMVNAIFDAAVRMEQPELKQTFREAAGEQAFQAAVYGKQELLKIFSDIRQHHWQNILDQAARIKQRPVRIEPSFMSDRYGIQGRLDCMLEDPDKPAAKDILELKSGSPLPVGSRISHKMQVTGYNLLLRSAFGPERTGSSVIFYSRATENPLRDVSNDHLAEHRLLRLRNEVIHYLLRMAENDVSVFDLINSTAAAGLPSFHAAHFRTFEQAWLSADEFTKTYYRQYIGFLCREFLCARTGAYSSADREDQVDGFAALWRKSEDDKKATFSIITDLVIDDISEDGMRIVLKRTPAEHSFRSGDMVLFYPKSGDELKPMQQQFIKGRLEDIRTNKVIIGLNHGQISRSYFDEHTHWVIEPDLYDKSYWTSAADLFRILTADKHRQALFFGRQPPVLPGPAVYSEDTAERIVEQAVAAPEYFLIQGPPGTGKTSRVLTEIVRRVLEKGESVVVVAFTNRAVEEIVQQLGRRSIPFLKLGSRHSGAEMQLRNFCREGDIEGARNFMLQHKVFVSTVATMAGKVDALFQLIPEIGTLIVDEASQLTEPQIAGLVCRFRKFILIGDQNQLPPVVMQDASFLRHFDQEWKHLGVSLFERLIRQAGKNGWDHAWGMLEKHYRMHEEIASLVNPWYGNRLVIGQDLQRSQLQHISMAIASNPLLASSRRLFIPSSYDPTYKRNRDEANKVVQLLHWLKEARGNAFDPLEDVGVITPWRSQIAQIRECLGDEDVWRSVQVDTIERYQGSEKGTILVSMAVSHGRQLSMIQSPTEFEYEENGHLVKAEVERKLLVTLSRARDRIILIGYEPALLSDPFYRSVLTQFDRVSID